MEMRTLILSLVLLTVPGPSWVIRTTHAQTAAQDQVTSLPGLNDAINFTQYSGYFTVNRGQQLHYWFVESQSNPATDPVILWLNGGPGCSSLYGFLRELGPFRVNPDGQTLNINPYSWNRIANVVFLESPAGVGFSYAPDHDVRHSDDSTAADNLLAVQTFFQRFPQFTTNDFYIFGESYAGIYVPTLSVKIIEETSFNFKGFGVGNALSSYEINDDSYLYFAYAHGLFDDYIMAGLQSNCCPGDISLRCAFSSSTDQTCQDFVSEANTAINVAGLNVYSLYKPCISSSGRLRADLSNLFRKQGYGKMLAEKLLQQQNSIRSDAPCLDNAHVANYLNLQEVRDALHIPAEALDWTMCSDPVGVLFQRNYDNMTSQYQRILGEGLYRGLVYNGDTDMACNYLGDQWFTNDLGFPVVTSRRAWTYDTFTTGFVKQFANLQYVTVLGSGHMVPEDAPGAGFKMFSSFLQNIPLD